MAEGYGSERRRGHVSPSLASLADFPWKRIKQFHRWRRGGGGAQNLLPSVPSPVPALPLRRPGHDEADASDRRSRERQGKVALSLPLCLPPRRPDSRRRHGARQPARIKIAFIRKWREALKSTSSLGSSDQRKVACFDKGNHNERDVPPPSPAIKECALFPI